MREPERDIRDFSLFNQGSLAKKLVNVVLVASLALTVSIAAAADAPKKIKKKPYFPTYPKPTYKTEAEHKLIARGEYLVKAGDCISCHTDTQGEKHGKPFAGGYHFKTPFGTFYTPNLTFDEATGIGKWTYDDFKRAMHKGIRANGSNAYPVFPYPYFTEIHDQDLRAIWAYLRAIPKINYQVPKNDVPFPFSWRFLQWGWKLLFFEFYQGQYKYDAHQTKQWNRGAYLVNGLGHCGMCHTPLNVFGAPKRKYFLRGGFVDGYYAPDITGDALKGESIDNIVKVFTNYQMLRHAGKVQGPMEEVDHNSLTYLKRSDLEAIAVYLKTVHSEKPPEKKITGSNVGKEVYASHCDACHANGAAGAPIFGSKADWDPKIKLGMKTLYKNAIHGINSMPPKGTCMSCSDADIEAAVRYMVEAVKKGVPGGGMKVIPKPKALTLAQGKKLYEANCAACHNSGARGAPKLGDKKVWTPLIKEKDVDGLLTALLRDHPQQPKPACKQCNVAEYKAALKYLLQESRPNKLYNFSEW